MRTKGSKNRPRNDSASSTPIEQERLPVVESNADNAEEISGKRVGVAVYFDDAGKIQWNRMHAKSKQQLKDLLSNPEISSILGSPLPKEVTQIFDPAWSGSILDGMAIVESVIAQKFMHISRESCAQAFVFTENEKKIASPFLSNVLNKYATKYKLDFLKDFKDEIGLVLILSAMMQTKFAYAKELDERKALKVAAPVTEIRNDSMDTPEVMKAMPVQ